ncbi:cytochrome b/b6 domain-containing protein [Halobacillus naozhouensis]|uniref:Cytochrome b/b6 domain-containing protein n=1 Tax=Halobacillus naozhouensis TaxID=554880 RepID=A0ABY8IWT0_9BACI|nr:cytochrome b/b6 domain-containing protein [Halobacillus naozhouensis]WFT74485.1 cytochrome b/b6 domain-containing protein [Halobacillus naozhouensis]
MSKKKKAPSFDLLLHWISAILVFLLLLSGMSIVGAKFSWILGNHFALADITHRVVGVFWVLWVFIAVLYEIRQVLNDPASKRTWLPIGKKGFARFNLLFSLLMILSGFLLWFMPSVPFTYAVFGFVVHEFFAFLILFVIVCHIIRKRNIFRLPLVNKKGRK